MQTVLKNFFREAENLNSVCVASGNINTVTKETEV